MIRKAPSSATPAKARKPANRSGKSAGVISGPTFDLEQGLRDRGIWPVAGCDEAGRGPLAGPVVAAAVVLDPLRIPVGLNDSKKLTEKRREALFDEICATATVAVAYAPPERIDRDNILQASLWALAQAVRGLSIAPRHVLVDGRDRIKVPCDCEPVIGGDARVLSIAAASIVAKVSRDRLMCALAVEFPAYGFDGHKGYGVPIHLAALAEHGPTVHHRHSFAPVAAAHEKHAAMARAAEMLAEKHVVPPVRLLRGG